MYSSVERAAKRSFDIALSAFGLTLAAPVITCAAVAIKASSPGPVFFRQERIGRGGRAFGLYKLRTMRVSEGGPLITSSGDARVTQVGRFLRRSKLDELPQLLNVLRGDLSFVGPRPEVARYVALYPAPARAFLQQFRPGITDPATVRFRNEEEILAQASDPERTYVEEILPLKVGMYVDYMAKATFAMDLRVLIDTLLAVVKPTTSPS